MQTITELEKQIKNICKNLMPEQDYYSIEKLSLQSYDEVGNIAVFCAPDVTYAKYIEIKFSQILIQALESIVGKPAYIQCQYPSKISSVHERFSVLRQQNEEAQLPSSDFEKAESLLDQISHLRKRIEILESKFPN